MKHAFAAGVGTSEAVDAEAAGSEAAARATEGHEGEPTVVLLFSTARQNAEKLTQGVRSVVGASTPLFGGYCNGVISNDLIGYDGFQVGVAALWLDGVEVELLKQEGIAFNEAAAGDGLGAQLAATLGDGPLDDTSLLFLYDSVNRVKGRFTMNLATPLIQGMNAHLEHWPAAAGARVMGDMKFNPTHQWCGTELLQDSAVAMVLRGDARMHTTVMHGCRPASAYHRITKVDGPVVLEVDGRSATEWLGDMLGAELLNSHEQYKFFVTFGVNHGDPWGPFVEDHYANKMCVGVDSERGGVILAEPLDAGTVFQLMRRNFEPVYTRDHAVALIDSIEAVGRRPVFGFYLNCAGRAAAYYGGDEEEAAHVQDAVDRRFPLLGVYEAGEITRVNDEMQLLDWTGIFNVFSVEDR